MSDKRREKRFRREHRHGVTITTADEFFDGSPVRIIYRAKTPEEARRRVARAMAFQGKPFLKLPPGNRDPKSVALVAADGTPVLVEDVEMLYNDMLLMDAVSDYGKDGPLMQDTLDTPLEREALAWAITAYGGATWDTRGTPRMVQ